MNAYISFKIEKRFTILLDLQDIFLCHAYRRRLTVLKVAFCLPVCIAFKRDCPGPSEREFRAISFCNKSVAFTYSCLYDENRGENVESCKATVDFAPPGNKYVQRGQPDFTPCAKSRYQPFRLWSNVSGQCIFKKSQCVSDGQFLYNNGTTESDRSCRCDYTHGYVFINKPRHPCYCIPSEEDCSCYKKYCPNNRLLTPGRYCRPLVLMIDYEQEDNILGKESYRCPIIVNDRLSTDSFSINQYNLLWEKLWNEFSPKCIAFLVTAVCTLLIVVEERKPLAPNDILLHADADTYGITVTWSHPSHKSADRRWHFKIKWRVNDSVDECSPKVAGTVNKYKIPDVFPRAEYKITVTACISEFDDTEHGGYYRESEPSEESTITTEDPQQPQYLKAIEELNGINLSWEPPRFPSFTRIINYKVQQICDGHEKTICVPAEKSSYLVSDVFPSQTYSFAIKSTCRTLDNTCDSELSHSIKCTAKDILYSSEKKNSYLMLDVVPSQTYSFAIKTCCLTSDKECESNFSVPINCTAKEPFPPKDLQAVANFKGIYLTWSVPEYPTIDKIRHFIVEINFGNKDIINVSSDKISLLISDVFPSTSYSIRMAISVRTGNNIQTDVIQSSGIKTESEYTELIHCKTPDPLQPIDVIASPRPNGIMVSWTSPDYPTQDKIRCYKLVMTNLYDETQTRDIKPNNKGDGSILMSNVSSNTEYSFTIATAAKGPTNFREVCQLPCDTESVPSKIVKCVTKADNYEAASSMDYDLILLLRFWLSSNEQEVPTIQFDKKPSKVDTSIQADLSRIYLTRKRYQNSSIKTISVKQFDEEWKYLCMAVVRLGGYKFEEKCTRLLRQLSSQVSRQMSNANDEKIGNQDIVEPILREQENKSSEPHECSCQEDACGRLFPVQESVQYLIEHNRNFKQMVQAGKTKIMISFTACVYWKTIFSKTDVFFRKHIKDLAPEYSDQYAPQQIVRKDEFEITWRDQLDDWFLNDTSKHCALFLTTINDGCISTLCFKQDETQLEGRMQEILQKYSLECDQVCENGGVWTIGIINTKELQEIAITGKFQRSPLLVACSHGYEELVSFMLRHVDNNIKDKTVSALFRITVDQGYPLSVVKLLKSSGANLKFVWDDSWTALNAACQRGNQDIANFLIDEGSIFNTVDTLGTTLLMLACYTGLNETVQLLIKKGVDINVLNNRKMSALKYACISGHKNIVSLLLDNEADSSTVYHDGRTPLVIAFEEKHDHILTLLKNKGFDVESTDKLGKTALAMACTNGDRDTVKSLIKLGANINSRDNKGWVPLGHACNRGSEEIVDVLLLEETIDLNIEDNNGWTPLKKASLNGHSKIVDILLNTNKLEIDKADNDGWTPLMSSCQKGHVTISELLLCNNADVNHRSNDGVTPLMTATQNDHIAVINLLLENNANVDLDNNDGWTPLRVACNANAEKAGYTPLKIACRNGYYKISSLLIEEGADVNRKDNDGWTPVQTASKTGHLKICKLLLSHKADINIADFRRCTPLHIASRNGQTDIVEWLLKNNAKIDQLDDDGWTALMLACQFGNKNIANLLLKNGSCVNHQSLKKLTPLIAACQNNNNEVMDILIKNEANVNDFNVDGLTPLHFTCMRGHIKASEILIQSGADVNKADNKGWTPLKFACRNKKASLVQILINAKADVNVVDKDGWTPLKTACRVGDEDTVEVLLNNNADINKEDKEGWTPLKSASVNEHYQIVKKLLMKNADINKVDHEGWTSLMSACKVGNFKVINVLLEHVKYAADVNCYSESTGDTPLIIACTYSDDGEIIKLLLEKGADWKKQNNIGQTALLLACMYGKTQNVSKLLDYRVDKDVTDKDGVSPLKAACQGLYLEIVDLLIKAGANIDIADLNGYTPLISACETQNHELVELLIRNKANINKSTPDGWNPYLIAIKNHDDEIANLLIKKGADKSKASLAKACEIGHLPIIQFLLDQDCSIESKEIGVINPLKMVIEKRQFVVLDLFIKKGRTFDHSMLKDLIDEFDEEGLSALAKACRDANTETLIYLLEHGADIFQPDKRGISPLIYACLNGNKHNVDLLLEKLEKVVDENGKIVIDSCRSYLNKADNDGYTPLTAATSRGHVPLIELLILNGTDVDKLDDCGKAPIMYACENGDLHTVKCLVSNGASITIISDKACSPLTLAKQANAWDIVDYFIEMGIRLNHEDLLSISTTESGNEKRSGNDFFTMACKNGYKALVELIIDEKQADLNSPVCEGLTPLMYACKMNQTKIVEVIVKKGIDIDSESSEGKTALMFVCVEGYTDIVEILLKNHATVNKCDNTGLTSLMIACEKGSLSCVKLLTKYGADMDIKSSELSGFMIACYTENYEIVDYLVSQKSYKPLKYDVRTLLDRTHGKELIQSVCKGGYESLFNILIESEDKIDAADGDGNSLLLLASQGGHDGIIETW
ncbi:unnamed protein product [Mytilus edulis]|uniref:Fibronectin type-III domain-containing protein n=1 Tax=Mytilus edulis TaxID=6550 RepID=A0A8S3S0J5_MYTED|nr:unnamed protein product [Mytilus edulis]